MLPMIALAVIGMHPHGLIRAEKRLSNRHSPRCDGCARIVPGFPTETSLLALISPATLGVFALGFVAAWLFDRKRAYPLIMAAAIALFCLAATSQILFVPSDRGLNAMVSGALYSACTFATIEAMLRRSGRSIGWLLPAVGFAAISVLLWYFYYVSPSLITRIYVQNFGYGLFFLYAALRLSDLRRGKPIDRAVFWVFFAFALHFFPRTLTTLGLATPPSGSAFGATPFWITLHISLAVFGVALALTLLAAAMIDRIDDLRADRDADPLTGLLNRRGFDERGNRLAANPDARPVSLIVCDIDHFKRVNDTYGHVEGDRVLQAFAMVLARTIRKGDLAARIGGEEFVVLMRNTSAAKAQVLAERIRAALAAARPLDEAPVTASFGVAEARPGEVLWQVVNRADAMLYVAKSEGRDRVAVWVEPPGTAASPPLAPEGEMAVVRLRRPSDGA
jgi:diguanylate cyclase (GGDEF)-like protein